MKNNFHFYLTWNDNNFLPFQRVLVKSDKSKVLYALVFYIYIYIFRFTFSDTYFRPRTNCYFYSSRTRGPSSRKILFVNRLLEGNDEEDVANLELRNTWWRVNDTGRKIFNGNP